MKTDTLYTLPVLVKTRWASAENPDGLPGAGGETNGGRKGRPFVPLAAGETYVMAHGEGVGTVRRLWVTISDRSPALLRGLVLRMYWDDAEAPAVEAPLGDFFGVALGRNAAFENAWFDNPEGRSFNCRLPMPFRSGFRITVTNESPVDLPMFFYDVNYTLGDSHGSDAGYFHAYFHRDNPTTLRQDFQILPRIHGRGRYLGATLGAIADTARYDTSWWGEGEVKVYLDGDTVLPTLCGTGTEDYIATGWGQGQYAHQWHGCPVADHPRMQFSFYRLHGPDPVFFYTDARVTIQQIGCEERGVLARTMRAHGIAELPNAGAGMLTPEQVEQGVDYRLFERQDDWCATAYFYLDRPTADLPPIQPYAERVAGLTGD